MAPSRGGGVGSGGLRECVSAAVESWCSGSGDEVNKGGWEGVEVREG